METHETSTAAHSGPAQPDRPMTPSARVLSRGIVLPELRVAFVPIPKAACTSILWTLAGLAELSPERFETSSILEVSKELTVHDLRRWPEELLLARRDSAQRDEMFASDDWFTFSVVRDPATRLWSAWQSKVLLREPKVARRFAQEPWWPAVPRTADDILEAFRSFVASLDPPSGAPPFDLHWWPQSELLDLPGPGLHHIGHVEALEATVQRLTEHVGGDRMPSGIATRNPSLLPFSWGLFDEQAVETLRSRFAADYERFDYPPPRTASGTDGIDEWRTTAVRQIAAVRTIIDQNGRIGSIHASLTAERDGLRRQLTGSENRLAQMRNGLAEERQQLKEAQKQRAQQEKRLETTQKKLRETSRRLEALQRSTSWRVTRPIRLVGELARRAKTRLARARRPESGE